MQPVSLSRDELITQMSLSYDTFAGALIGEHMDKGIADYQRTTFWRLVSPEIEKYASAMPRGHIKTTLVKLAIIYRLLYNSSRFVLYVSGIHDLAASNCEDIMDILQSPQFAAIYGKILVRRSRTTTADYIVEMPTVEFANDGAVKIVYRKCILRGRSVGQKIRGLTRNFARPDFIAMDDIDHAGERSVEVEYAAVKEWVYGPLLKIGRKGTLFRQVGNYTQTRSLIGDHITDTEWVSDHYSALLPDGTTLWPDEWTAEALLSDFRSYAKQGMAGKWFAEMLNNPLENASGIISFSDIRRLPDVPPYSASYACPFITVDPAISKTRYANESAIAVHGFNLERDVWQNLEMVCKKGLDSIKLFDTLVELSVKWGARVWVIESVAYQAALLTLYPVFLANAGLSHIVVKPAIGSTTAKSARIITFLSLIKRGGYALSDSQVGLVQRILAYRPDVSDQADDALDACAYFVRSMPEYIDLINQTVGPAAELSGSANEAIDTGQFLTR